MPERDSGTASLHRFVGNAPFPGSGGSWYQLLASSSEGEP
jgi:hypothetical protein